MSEAKPRDVFSSLDILVIDEAAAIEMQNWTHITRIIPELNAQPFNSKNTDFSRLRSYFTEDWSKHFRQTIVLSSHLSPSINGLFSSLTNHAGKLKIRPKYKGVLGKVVPVVRQMFHRLEVSSLENLFDERFNHFQEELFPQIRSSTLGKIIIVVPEYHDFCRLRAEFTKHVYQFQPLCEHDEQKTIDKVRNKFATGEADILLTTERFHFYFRFVLTGAERIVFYSPPEMEEFYADMVNWLPTGGSFTTNCVWTKYDALAVERIVGSKRSHLMQKSTQNTFMFLGAEKKQK